MNTETLEKMKQLRLWGMYQAFKASMEADKTTTLTADELVSVLVGREWDDRQNRNIERGIRNARFRYQATIEQLDYGVGRKLDKNFIHRLGKVSLSKTRKISLLPALPERGKAIWPRQSDTRPVSWVLKCFMPMSQS